MERKKRNFEITKITNDKLVGFLKGIFQSILGFFDSLSEVWFVTC